MEGLSQDIRYAFRQLVKSPGFSVVAMLTLALGIGATTAIFSVVYSVIIRPLPYPESERIVEVERKIPQGYGENTTFYKFKFWRENSKIFEHMGASAGAGFNLTTGGSAERIRGMRVSWDYLEVLGVRPLLGRTISPEEDTGEGLHVAVLSNGLWKRDFGTNPGIVGQAISLDGQPYTVIGVMPAGFQTISHSDVWVPLALEPRGMLGGTNFTPIGRLHPGVTIQQADASMEVVAEEFRKAYPNQMRKTESVDVVGYRTYAARDVQETLLIFLGAVTFVLLIACVNVANLLLTRAVTRGREIAIRTALGASRARLIRQLLTESVMLALAGAAVGVVLANVGLHSILAVIPSELPRAQEISVDRWALAFAALIAVATGILFGLAPAFQASRSDPQETLKENASRGVIGTRKVWLRSALVVSEVALSLVLLIGAGLLTRTFANLLGTSAGFDPHKTLSIELWMTGQNYSKPAGMAQFFQTALPRIRSMPGVEDVAVVVAGQPLETGGNWFMVPFGKDERADGFSADYREITPDYFRTLGIPMKAGREFLDSDAAGAHRVAIVNEAFAQHVFPHMNPLGQVINIAPETKNGELWEIAGVSSDAKSSLDEPAEPTIFIPSAQAEGSETRLFNGIFPAHLLIRSAGNPASLTDAVTRELHSVDSSLPLGKAQTMQEVFSASVGDQQFNVLILAVFAGAALLLAVVGIYGVMAYSVQQRTHEIGVRMALGAQQTSILRMVLGQGLWLALIGVALGIAGALGVTRVLSSMLFGVKSTDPWTFAGVSLGLLAVALLASYIPARRAMRVDPMVALRYE